MAVLRRLLPVWMPIATCATLASLALTLLMAGSAAGYVDPPVKLGLNAEHLSASAGWLNETSPRKTSGFTPTSSTEQVYQGSTETSPDFDTGVSEELDSETTTLVEDTGLWDWGLAPEVAVGLGGGYAGWEIGSAIYGVFFGEATEEGGGEKTVSSLADRWTVYRPGQGMYSDPSGNSYSPAWGLRGENHQKGAQAWTTNTGNCEQILYGDGVRIYNPGFLHSGSSCYGEFQDFSIWRPLTILRCGGLACPGIEPIPFAPTKQPTLPTTKQLEEKTQKELESSAFPIVNRFLNYLAEPERFPDPRVTKTEEDHRCDRTPGPTYENAEGNGSPEPFAKKLESAFTVTNVPEGVEPNPVYLRWGTTYWRPGREGFEGTSYLDDWGGWGYRHILAKHGWSALDREETELALSTGTPISQGGGLYRYETPEIANGIGGVECTRRVVVQFETGLDPETDEEDPAPRGIVTSFNKVE